jgi:hypothetical protein
MTKHSFPWISIVNVLLLAVAVPASGQEPGNLFQSVQGGPFVGATTGNGATFEYGLRVGMRTGAWRADVTSSAIPVRPLSSCSPSSSACRVTVHYEILGGIARAIGSGTDAPSVGFRAGIGTQQSIESQRAKFAVGPYVSVGLPLLAQIGIRAEGGVLTYTARGRLPNGRAYVSLGLQGRP